MKRPSTLRTISLLSLAAAIGLATAITSKAALVFDNMSAFEGGNTNAHIASTSSTPNTFMGAAYNLLPGTTQITGFDIYPVNLSGTSYIGLRINIYVWGTVNTSGTVNATTPAFGNLLATYTLTTAGAFNNGFYFPFENAIPGSAPGITLGAPLPISSTQVGITFNYQGTTDGTTYNSVNSLTSLIEYGVAPTVGSTVFSGYYRNAGSPTEVNGNFTSSLRTLGNPNESLALRVYGDVVPEPTTMALGGFGAAVLLILRRRK